MGEPVYITGSGLVTPLGATGKQTWTALLDGHYIRTHSAALLGDVSDQRRLFQIAQHAACEAIDRACWTHARLSSDRTALLVGRSKGSADAPINAPPFLEKMSTSDNAGAAGRLSFGLASLADSLAAHFQLGFGPRLTMAAACASGLHALIRAVMLVRSGVIDRALVVAAESSLQPLYLACFQRLGVFAPAGTTCMPFDVNRAGFLMSEAAAAVCVERAGVAQARPIVEVDRFALGGDATHLTAADPEARTLRYLLARCTKNETFDLVHAHGTGTPTNDATELNAIAATFELDKYSDVPAVYSHKGAAGHSLGAAGLVAVVVNGFAHESNTVPPNVQTLTPITTTLGLSTTTTHRRIQNSLVSAAGFGGAAAVVSLRSP